MKKLLSLLFVVSVMVGAVASDFPLAQSAGTITASNYFYLTNGATLYSVTNSTEFATYHTFQISTTSTNAGTNYIDRSLGGTTWYTVSSNNLTGNGSSETNFTGKWTYMRVRCYGTNSAVSVNYLGGR